MFQDIYEVENWLFQYGFPLSSIRIQGVMLQRYGKPFRVWHELAVRLIEQPDLVSAMLRHNDWRFSFRGTMIAWLQHKTQNYEKDFIYRLSKGMGFGPQTVAAGWTVLTRPEYIPSMEAILHGAMQSPLDSKRQRTLLSVYAALLHHSSPVATKFAESTLFHTLQNTGYYDSIKMTQGYVKAMLPLP